MCLPICPLAVPYALAAAVAPSVVRNRPARRPGPYVWQTLKYVCVGFRTLLLGVVPMGLVSYALLICFVGVSQDPDATVVVSLPILVVGFLLNIATFLVLCASLPPRRPTCWWPCRRRPAARSAGITWCS